ncbi:MAG: hypothetical protein GXO42_03130 [bacterium]|nr:hypothetical protein [bacterium]
MQNKERRFIVRFFLFLALLFPVFYLLSFLLALPELWLYTLSGCQVQGRCAVCGSEKFYLDWKCTGCCSMLCETALVLADSFGKKFRRVLLGCSILYLINMIRLLLIIIWPPAHVLFWLLNALLVPLLWYWLVRLESVAQHCSKAAE